MEVDALLSLQIVNAVQVIVVLALSPLVAGVLKKLEARVESRKGISVFQPYRDLAKFFRKELVIPKNAGIFFVLAPVIAFSCYLILPMVLPIIYGNPCPYAPMVDFLGGAFIFGLAGFVTTIATANTGSFYTSIGTTRAVTFGSFAEPTLIMVFFGVALITETNNPFITNHVLAKNIHWVLSPTHLLIVAAFFMLLLFDTGKIPVESEGLMEFGMIDEGKAMEYSGPLYALLKWGSYMKSFILMSVFLNVFAFPWGVAMDTSAISIAYGIVTLLLKMLALIVAFVFVEETFAKLRLFKLIDYLTISFLLALLSVASFFIFGGVPA